MCRGMLLLIFKVWYFAVAVSCLEAPDVLTKQGLVRGSVEKSFEGNFYLSYKGIPYAEPPVGELRFKPTVDKLPWDGVLDATTNGPPCLQLNQFNESIVVGSEDCLTLNIYTRHVPDDEDSQLAPVLVWIHGGRWLVGSANSNLYSPVYLMDHNLVVVSIQYRLGALGFLSTQDSIASGNYGLHDQSKALQWLQDNIQAFGGDPNSVTIIGQSAGGASTHNHFFSHQSKGLFHRGIALSGCAMNYWAHRFDDHDRISKRQAYLLDCPTESSRELVDCLRKVDAKKLTLTQPQLHDFFGGTPAKLPLATFSPRIDADGEVPFFTDHAPNLIRKGDFAHLPLMLGVTSQEGAWIAATFFGQKSRKFLNEFDKNRKKAISALTAHFFSEEDIDKLISFYFNDNPINDDSQMVPLSELVSDLKFTFEILMAAYFHSRYSTAPVYMFQFNYRGNWSFAHEFEEIKHDYEGVAHVDDLRYLFRLAYGPELNDDEKSMMKRYTSMIADFAKNGKTYHNDWQPYQKELGQYMIIDVPEKSGLSRDKPFETKSRPGRMDLWRKLFKYEENFMDDFQVETKHEEL